MEGYIKLYRQITKWEWYEDANTFRLFIHLLIKANHSDANWRGNLIKRGQRFTSIGILSHELSLSEKAIRIAIDKLIRTNEIVCKGASNGTMITICKYDNYQSIELEEGQARGRTNGERKGKRGANEGRQTIITNNDENETKEQITNTIKSFDFKKAFLDLDVDVKILEDWLKVRKTKKAVNSETAFNGIKKKMEASGKSFNECVTISAEKSWAGFDIEWLKEKQTKYDNRANITKLKGEIVYEQF